VGVGDKTTNEIALKAGDSIPINGKGITKVPRRSHSHFRARCICTRMDADQREQGSGDGTSVSGSFPSSSGCGITYIFEVAEEISGSVEVKHTDYLASLTSRPISPNSVESITGTATFASVKTHSSGPPLVLHPTQCNGMLPFMSTVCSARDMALRVALQPDQFLARSS